jgi:hypothetical protein
MVEHVFVLFWAGLDAAPKSEKTCVFMGVFRLKKMLQSEKKTAVFAAHHCCK